jgi:hypothetical protein
MESFQLISAANSDDYDGDAEGVSSSSSMTPRIEYVQLSQPLQNQTALSPQERNQQLQELHRQQEQGQRYESPFNNYAITLPSGFVIQDISQDGLNTAMQMLQERGL